MIEKRFQNLNTRQRYELEYRECRIFNSYLDSQWDYEGDTARLNAYRSWQMRFALIKDMPRLSVYRLYERVIAELLEKWPNARNLQHGDCHCGESEWMVSFQLPSTDINWIERMPNYEHCGFWCYGCNWSNAGARLAKITPNT